MMKPLETEMPRLSLAVVGLGTIGAGVVQGNCVSDRDDAKSIRLADCKPLLTTEDNESILLAEAAKTIKRTSKRL